MAQKIKGITIEIGGDTTKLGNALKSVNGAITQTQSELRGINTLLKFDPKNTVLITQKQKLLTTAVVDTKDKLDALQETQRKIDDGSIQATEEQYRDLEREIASTEAKLEKLTQEQRQFASVSAIQLQAVGREFQKMGQKMSEAGQALLPLTIAIAAVGAASLKAAIDFESSFAGVRKTVDATEQEFRELAEASRQAAMNKPVDVNDINHIMELGGQLGVATDQLSKFASVIGDLDVATDMDIESASTNLAQFMNICGTATEDIDKLGSTIVGLGNNSATTESAIMDMAMRIAGSGSQIGLTESQILGLSASLSSVGIAAESGGSAISQIMSQIDKDVAMGGDALETWAATAGMTAQQFKDAWETDAAGALQSLLAGMQQAVESGGNINLVLNELGITALRQTDTLKRLTSASDLMASTMNIANTAWEENIALTNEAEQRYQTTESKLIMFKNQIIDIGISIGNGLKGALVGIMEAAQPLIMIIASLASAFENAAPPIQALIVGAIGLAAGVGPLMIVTGKLTEGLGSMMEAMGKAAVAMTAKAAATTADTASTAANTAAKTANTAALNLNIIKTALKEATDARLAMKTAASTAATTAYTGALVANTAATAASGTTAGASAIKTAALTVATKAKTIATTAATVAQVAWNAAMTANPIGTVVVAVTALVSVLGIAVSAIGSMAKNQDKLTAASQEQKKKVDQLKNAHDEAVKTQGEHSDAAIKAKAALDEETAAFEASKETIEQFKTRCEETITAHEELTQSIADSTQEAESQAGKLLYLSEQVSTLANIENKSAEEKAQLVAMTETLNASCEGLNLTYDEQTDSLNLTAEAIQLVAEAEADRLRAQAAMDSYSALLEDQINLEMQLVEAQENLAAETSNVANNYSYMFDQGTALSYQSTELEDTVGNLERALAENRTEQQRALEVSAKYATKQSVLERALQEVEAGTLSAEEAAQKYTAAVEGGITADDILAEQAHQAALAQQELAQKTNEAAAAIQDYVTAHPSFQAALDQSGLTVGEFSEILASQDVTFDEAATAIENYSQRAANGFSKVADSSQNTLDVLYDTLAYNLKATENWSANLEAVFGRTGVSFSEEFVNAVREGGVEEYGTVMAQLAEVSDAELQKISDAYARNGQAGVQSYLAEQRYLVPGTKEALEGTGEAVDEALAEGEAAAATSGTDTGNAYNENLKAIIASCPVEVQAYITDLEAQLASGVDAAGKSGTSTGASYSENLQAEISQCPPEVQAYIAELEDSFEDLETTAGDIGFTTGEDYSENTAKGIEGGISSVTTSAGKVNSSVQKKLADMPLYGRQAGTSTGSNLASGLSSQSPLATSAAGSIKSAITSVLSSINGTGYGQQAGNSFASGVGSTQGTVRSNADSAVSPVRTWSTISKDSKTWGQHAGEQFASGLRFSAGVVKSAATTVADTVWRVLHFTVPEEGPLADADQYGPDFMNLFADGIRSKISEVRLAATEAAQAAQSALAQKFTPTIALEPHLVTGDQMKIAQSSAAFSTRIGPALGATGAEPQTVNNFYGNITLSARDVEDIQTFDDFAKRLQHEMRVL